MKCESPFYVDTANTASYNGRSRMVPVRCGRCEACVKTEVSQWSFRLLQEAKLFVDHHFVTLTYSPEFVPLTKSGLPTVDPEHLSIFLKRLRERNRKYGNIRFFAVSEYGSRSYRPHYHSIIYGCRDVSLYSACWSFGYVHVGHSVTDGAIPYTLKYLNKKGLVPAFEGDDRVPEFRRMSRALGANFLTPQLERWILEDPKNRAYCRFPSGHLVSLPRFYQKRLIQKYNLYSGIFSHFEDIDIPENEVRTRHDAKNTRIRKWQRDRNRDLTQKL